MTLNSLQGLYALTMIVLSSQWLCVTFTTLYDLKNDFVRTQNASVHFSERPMTFSNYLLVHLHYDFEWPHSDSFGLSE